MEIDAMLQNWGRWALLRTQQGHCASLEHRYRSKLRPDDTPTGWGDWLTSPWTRMQPLPAIDERSALTVERAMRHLPDGHRKALKLHYVYRMPRKMICLRLAIRVADWDRYVGDAKHMIHNLLTRREKKNLIHSTIRLPVKTETLEPLGSECIG